MILRRDYGFLEQMVLRSCQIKADVVKKDECDRGIRAILNFGHTFGHALEKVSGYQKYLHGEAVAVGMVFSACVSAIRFDFPDAEFIIIGKHCDNSIKYLKSVASNNVRFTNFVSNEELLKWMQEAKIYVQISSHEAFGLSLAESMLCECIPVVTKRELKEGLV